MTTRPRQVLVYVDDGYPESREYDNNYRLVDLEQLREARHATLDLPKRRPAPDRDEPGFAGGPLQPQLA
jgi:hypothetical protein